MKKILFLMVILVMLVGVNTVYAQNSNTFDNTWDTLFKNTFMQKIFGPDLLNEEILLKIIFMFFIFAVLYGASNLALGAFSHNIRLVITLIMAIIAVAALPYTFLVTIAGIWGGAVVALMIGIPVLGGVYLMFKTFGDPTRFNYAAKFGIAVVLLWLLGALQTGSTNTLAGSVWWGAGSSGVYLVINQVVPLLFFFFFFMSIWYFIRIFTAETTLGTGEGVEGIAKNFEKMKKVKETIFGGGTAAASQIGELVNILENSKAALRGNRIDEAKKILGGVEGMIDNMSGGINQIAHAGSEVDSKTKALANNVVVKFDKLKDDLRDAINNDTSIGNINKLITKAKGLKKDIIGSQILSSKV